jgi:hypothetical protein
MDGFEWALDNLADYGADSPHGLQAQGVNVFFAPNIEPNTKVVDLGTGRVVRFVDGERRPLRGYYADYESLGRFCRKRGIPLVETNGQVSTEPAGKGEAGDPLLHGET